MNLSSYKSIIFAPQKIKFYFLLMLPKFKRILLKLSGESLMGDNNFGLDSAGNFTICPGYKTNNRIGCAGSYCNWWRKYLPGYERS